MCCQQKGNCVSVLENTFDEFIRRFGGDEEVLRIIIQDWVDDGRLFSFRTSYHILPRTSLRLEEGVDSWFHIVGHGKSQLKESRPR